MENLKLALRKMRSMRIVEGLKILADALAIYIMAATVLGGGDNVSVFGQTFSLSAIIPIFGLTLFVSWAIGKIIRNMGSQLRVLVLLVDPNQITEDTSKRVYAILLKYVSQLKK